MEDGTGDWEACLFVSADKKSRKRLHSLLDDVKPLYDACLSKSGSMMLMIKNDNVYLFDYGRSLDFNAPIPIRSGFNPSMLKSNRVPEFQELCRFAEKITG